MRQLLYAFACLFLSIVPVHGTTPDEINTTRSTHAEIIVIGAGLAGLSAARELHDAGKSVIVLEAKPHIGGRTYSQLLGTTPVDMGASWLHGVKGHPLTPLAEHLNLRLVPTDYDNDVLFDTEGKPSDADAPALRQYTKAMYRALYTAIESEDHNTSVAAALQHIPADIVGALPVSARDHITANHLDEEYGADPRALSVMALDEGLDYEGSDALIKQSYKPLVDKLAEDLDIRLTSPVTAIDYRESHIELSTERGKFSAPQVIVTLPLGVLQSGDIVFTPDLPTEKRRAIHALGVGLLNKLYLKFPRVFWHTDADVIAYQTPQRGRWLSWYDLSELSGEPILLGFTAADAADAVEALDDEQLVAEAMGVLRTLYGDDIPQPTLHLRSRWRADPYARGAYSFLKVGATQLARKHLAEPIDNRLFFAGEATDSDFPATTQGAYFSGLRAAQRLLNSD